MFKFLANLFNRTSFDLTEASFNKVLDMSAPYEFEESIKFKSPTMTYSNYRFTQNDWEVIYQHHPSQKTEILSVFHHGAPQMIASYLGGKLSFCEMGRRKVESKKLGFGEDLAVGRFLKKVRESIVARRTVL